MQITRQKIDPQGFQIQIQHTHSMRTINHTQHSQLLTFPHQRLKREPDRRNTNHHIKHRCLNVHPPPSSSLTFSTTSLNLFTISP